MEKMNCHGIFGSSTFLISLHSLSSLRCSYLLPCFLEAVAGPEDVVFVLVSAQFWADADPPPPQFCAVMGCGIGLRGQSYAIPTMQGGVETIKPYVDDFITFTKAHPELFFYVTRIGCGIAGFRDREIAPLFAEAKDLDNVCLPESFVKVLK